ncbi:MAG: hypothetical protein Q7T56_07395 [Nocardioidaceae bacterium]|nr:hypothetical protein [Nocardioidaceae bacterium]
MLICNRNEKPDHPHFSVRGEVLEIREKEGDTWPVLELYLSRGELVDLCHTLHNALRRWDEHEAQATADAKRRMAVPRSELPLRHEPWCTDHNYDGVPSWCVTDVAVDERTDLYLAPDSYTGEPEITLNIGATLLTMTASSAADLSAGIEENGPQISAALRQLADATAVTA